MSATIVVDRQSRYDVLMYGGICWGSHGKVSYVRLWFDVMRQSWYALLSKGGL